MLQRLQDLDLAQRSNRHPFLFIVHQDTFERHHPLSRFVNCFMDLTGRRVSGREHTPKEKDLPKSAFAELGGDIVVIGVSTATEDMSECVFLLLPSPPRSKSPFRFDFRSGCRWRCRFMLLFEHVHKRLGWKIGYRFRQGNGRGSMALIWSARS